MALADVAKLIVALTLDDKLTGPLGRVESGLGRMGKGVGQVGSGLVKLGTIAGAVAVGGIGLAAKSAIDFEDAFAGIKKTVDETDLRAAGLSFEDLSASIRKMAREIPVAATDLARIGEAAGALGIAAQDIDDFTEVVAKLSVTTNLTSEDAATALGQLGTVLHLTGGDFEDFADSLVALGNAGASTEDQIIAIAARFAASGRAAGLSKEDILAFSSATASMGIEVEAAGSSLSRTFNSITTNIGTGSAKAKLFAKTLGLSSAEFKKEWDKNASGTFVKFLGILGKLDKFEQANLLKKLGITQTRDLNALQLMTQNLGFFNDQIAISRDATGALSVEAAKKFDTVASHIQLVKNNLTDVGITVGNELLPIISDLTKEFADFLNQPGTQKGIAQFAQDLAGGVKSLVTELKGTDFSGIIDGMKLAATVAKGAFDAFRALPAPIQQLAIAALVANKVSGGAIGSIAKGLGNILLGGLKTITAANVTVIGKSVIGAGGGAAGAAGAAGQFAAARKFLPTGLVGWLGFLGIAAADFALIAEAVSVFQDQTKNVKVAADFERKVVADRTAEASLAELKKLRADLASEIAFQPENFLDDVLKEAFVTPELERQLAELDKRIAAATLQQGQADGTLIHLQQEATAKNIALISGLHLPLNAGNALLELIRARGAEQVQRAQETKQALDRWGGKLDVIAAKDFSPDVHVSTVVTVTNSATQVTQSIRRYLDSAKGDLLTNIL